MFTCAKMLKWCQKQIHEYLQFVWRTGGQVSQHHGSPRNGARLSTSASSSKSLHFAVEEPATNKEHFYLLKIGDLAFHQCTQDSIQDSTP